MGFLKGAYPHITLGVAFATQYRDVQRYSSSGFRCQNKILFAGSSTVVDT